MPKTQFCGYICGIMTTYQQILIILDDFEINFTGALFSPGTAVTAHCTVNTAHGKLYTAHFTLHTAYCSLYN